MYYSLCTVYYCVLGEALGDGSDLQLPSLMFVGMYGVIKGFMEVALADYTGDCPAPVISRKLQGDVLRKRGELLRLTADFGRPYLNEIISASRLAPLS